MSKKESYSRLPLRPLNELEHIPKVTSNSQIKIQTTPPSTTTTITTTSWYSLLQRVYLHIWTWFHIAWILSFKWLANPIFHPRPSTDPFTHHILVVGDDWALGIGDNGYPGAYSPGLARYLHFFLNRSASLRHTWSVLNFGERLTGTEDWLPPALSKRTPKGRLFSKLSPFAHPRHIVMIILGFYDTCVPMETFQNLLDTVTTLSKMFGYVYLCTLPDTTTTKDSLPECNKLLREWVRSLPKSTNIRLGAEIDKTNREYSLARVYAKDHVHFNRHGYMKMAKDFALAMEADCRKLEFQQEKKFLQ